MVETDLEARWWLPPLLARVDSVCRDPGYGSVGVEIRDGVVEFVRWSASLQRKKSLDTGLL